MLSAEPLYRAGRVIGIEHLDLRLGDSVVDLGCGTGLSFSLLEDRVGTSGRIVGVDASEGMLAQARRRADRHGWRNVVLLRADATSLDPTALIEALGRPADGVVATYALSVMADWQTAWETMLGVAGRAARLSVVDMQPPVGAAKALGWLARLACRLGGSDITARPWSQVEADCLAVRSASVLGGHVQIRSGRPARSSIGPARHHPAPGSG